MDKGRIYNEGDRVEGEIEGSNQNSVVKVKKILKSTMSLFIQNCNKSKSKGSKVNYIKSTSWDHCFCVILYASSKHIQNFRIQSLVTSDISVQDIISHLYCCKFLLNDFPTSILGSLELISQNTRQTILCRQKSGFALSLLKSFNGSPCHSKLSQSLYNGTQDPTWLAHSLQLSIPQCYLSNLTSFDFLPIANSTPATLVSWLFPQHLKHASALGLLHLEFPQPGILSPQISIHMTHSFISFAQLATSPEDFSVKPSLFILFKIVKHPTALPLLLLCYFLHITCHYLALYICSCQSPYLQILLILQSHLGLDCSFMPSPTMAAPQFSPFSKIHHTSLYTMSLTTDIWLSYCYIKGPCFHLLTSRK